MLVICIHWKLLFYNNWYLIGIENKKKLTMDNRFIVIFEYTVGGFVV